MKQLNEQQRLCASELSTQLVSRLEQYCENAGKHTLVVGVSGGIDSAVVASICARTKVNTLLARMPHGYNTSKESLERARQQCKSLSNQHDNVSHIEVPIAGMWSTLNVMLNSTKTWNLSVPDSDKVDLANANSQSRLRMLTLYHIATINNGLVIGTGNRIEDFCIGFFTKYGDGGVDVSPIGDLYKSQVYLLGHYYQVSDKILTATPSDELWQDGRSDEQQLGCSYKLLEYAARYIDYNQHPPSDVNEQEFNDALQIIRTKREQNQHKLNTPPVFAIDSIAAQITEDLI